MSGAVSNPLPLLRHDGHGQAHCGSKRRRLGGPAIIRRSPFKRAIRRPAGPTTARTAARLSVNGFHRRQGTRRQRSGVAAFSAGGKFEAEVWGRGPHGCSPRTRQRRGWPADARHRLGSLVADSDPHPPSGISSINSGAKPTQATLWDWTVTLGKQSTWSSPEKGSARFSDRIGIRPPSEMPIAATACESLDGPPARGSGRHLRARERGWGYFIITAAT